MKAIFLSSKGGPESLVLGEVAQPHPGPGEVLVKVHATAVTPAEFEWFPTWNMPDGSPRPFPVVLSHEFSGTIEALGAEVTGLKAGDPIYGLNDWFSNGAQAEYCVAPAGAIAPKPRMLNDAHSTAVPISALTAWQGLFNRAGLRGGQLVLIHGAEGGVGIFAVQLARWRGAHVVATASVGNLDFVCLLGANEVIDYRKTRFEDVVRDVDVVFDGVGGDTLDRSWEVLVKGGKLVTVASQSAESTDQRVRDAFTLVQADGSQLTEISNLIDTGELRMFIENVFPLGKAQEAYARAQRGKMRGKIALSVAI